MNHRSGWPTLTVVAMMLAVSPALAANPQTSGTRATQLPITAPATVQAQAPRPTMQPAPMLTARVPFENEWNSTVLAANSQAMGLQVSRRGMARPMRMAIAGAAIGAIVGAVAGNPLSDAAIGGVAGFGIAYVMRH